jgi:hypothetical protein
MSTQLAQAMPTDILANAAASVRLEGLFTDARTSTDVRFVALALLQQLQVHSFDGSPAGTSEGGSRATTPSTFI